MEDLHTLNTPGRRMSDASVPQTTHQTLFFEPFSYDSEILANTTCFGDAFEDELEPCSCLESAFTSTDFARS